MTAVTGKLKIGETRTRGYYYPQIVVKDQSARKGGVAEQWTDFEVTQ